MGKGQLNPITELGPLDALRGLHDGRGYDELIHNTVVMSDVEISIRVLDVETLMEIKVLGPGCAKCQQVENWVKEVVVEAGVEARIEKVTDTMEIAGYGVFGTPAIVIDGNVKSVGKIPDKKEIAAWLKP